VAINKEFKKIIETIKANYNLSQKEIALKLDVGNTYLSDMIHGRVPATSKTTNKIYELFQIGTPEVESPPVVSESEAEYKRTCAARKNRWRCMGDVVNSRSDSSF
jgi:ribosome-binding protein aMBF1 (putative translation factor)